jgi:hypothetical protein
MPTNIAERRRFTRFPRSELVQISFENPTLVTVEAELVEMSATGFRIAHESRELISGMDVSLRRDKVSNRARVVWSHLLNGRRVAGCVLL